MADLGFLRGYNDAVILGLVRSGESLTRVELAERSGLTPQAVSKIVARLTDAGVLESAGTRNVGVGKPRTLLRLVPEGGLAFGVHVERDELRVVLVDLAGTVLDRVITPLSAGFGPSTLIDELARVIAAMRAVAMDRLLGVGIGIVGPLDHRAGVVHDATGLPGWHDVPLRDLATKRLGVPVRVDKDTNVAVLAESWRRGPDFRHAAVIFAGTGLGAGLLLDGRVHRGARSGAGEFGHTTIQLDGPLCACGRRGCAEVLHNQAVSSGDLARASNVLGIATAGLARLLDVEQIVLSGRSVLAAPDRYLDGLRAHLPGTGWLAVEVSVTALGPDVVAAGAAMLVLNDFFAPVLDASLL
ncbi:ROK family transcriptional regulator [Actinocrispum sp. NPDC049592]|uniref:ROK family transcriptional regulator n=1 Tax=Actinocrispum sp. NPDC049592 TaxID=3154835 RepID=UPI003418D9B3